MSIQNTIKFMAFRHIAAIVSAVLILISLASLTFRGLNFGLDFTGGINVQAQTEQVVDTNELQDFLVDQGFKGAKVQTLDNEQSLLIRFQENEQLEGDTAELVIDLLNQQFSKATLESSTEISSSFGDEMKATV